LIGLVLMVALLGIASATLASSEAACSSCHTMKPYAEATKTSQHASVGCRQCHGADAQASIALTSRVLGRMLPAWLKGAESLTGPGTLVPSAACLSCHADILDVETESMGMRIKHGSCVGESGDCDDCHTSATHGDAVRWPRQPVMEDCILCHQDQGGPTECDSCHEGKLQTERLAQGPWQVTHGPEWKKNHGSGTLRTCMTCHPDDYCVDCHGIELPHAVDFGKLHGVIARQTPDSCVTCHDGSAFCTACHGIEMPHPDGFLAQHPDVAQGYSDKMCLNCHRAKDCDACHVKHTHPGNTEGTIGGDGG
jgi:hypothetical protein